MKFLLVACFAFIAVVSGAYVPVDDNFEIILAQNVISKLMRQTLEAVRKMLKEHEQFQIPDFAPQHIVDKDIDIDINADIKEVKISKADDFTIDHIEHNLPQLWFKFGVTVPKMHLEGQYKASGVIQQKKVSGSGTLTVDLDTFVQNVEFGMDVINLDLQIIKLQLDFSLKGLKFDLNGLSIEGMTTEQAEDLLNTQYFKYLQTNKKEVCEVVSRQVVKYANNFMAGKTLRELLDLLKKFIDQ